MATKKEDRVKLDTGRLVELLEEAVGEKPEGYHYPTPSEDARYHRITGIASCKYFLDNGEPACIIGVVLDKLGLEPPEGHRDSGAYAVLTRLTKLDPKGLALAQMVQHKQDRGMPWADAVSTSKVSLLNNPA